MVSAAPPAAEGRLDRSTRFFYGLGSVAFGVKDNGFSFMLMLFYNQVLGVPGVSDVLCKRRFGSLIALSAS